MKHIIIGTAGHIDHGKTSLIGSMTGRNTDRLKEEKERGISIELGFTYFDLPSGNRAGIVDVPGHEKFVRQMLAGAVGIDIVILVVSADEGIMPQTREHLDIMNLLGIKKGIIALNKIDIVDDILLELAKEEVKEEVKGTFLEDAPIVEVSAKKGKGINKLIEKIDNLVIETEEKDEDENPRLPIDRSFSISGFGTIVTGTLMTGKVKIGDELQIYPSEKVGRIRTIQVHDEDKSVAYAGQRVAMNLAGISVEEAARGNVLALPNSMDISRMLNVKMKLLPNISKSITNRTRVRISIGTKEVLGRIVLLDKDVLNPGEEGFVQFRLEEEVSVKYGDKFIVRFYSPMFTIGGGVILDSNPVKVTSSNKDIIKDLKIRALGDYEKIILSLIKNYRNLSMEYNLIKNEIDISDKKLLQNLEKLEEDKKIKSFDINNNIYYIDYSRYNKLIENLLKELKDYHKSNHLSPGISKEEIREKNFKNIPNRVSDIIIEDLIDSKIIDQDNGYLKLYGFNIEYKESELILKNNIIDILDKSGLLIPKIEDILEETSAEEDLFYEIIDALVYTEEIIKLKEGLYVLNKTLEKLKEDLKLYLEKNKRVSISEFRDEYNINRRSSIALLEYLDDIHFTRRVENDRILY